MGHFYIKQQRFCADCIFSSSWRFNFHGYNGITEVHFSAQLAIHLYLQTFSIR